MSSFLKKIKKRLQPSKKLTSSGTSTHTATSSISVGTDLSTDTRFGGTCSIQRNLETDDVTAVPDADRGRGSRIVSLDSPRGSGSPIPTPGRDDSLTGGVSLL